MKIIIIGGLPESLINFRGELIKRFVELNYDVVAMAAPTDLDTIKRIEHLGCRFIPFPIARNGMNPLSDMKTLSALYKTFKRERPNYVLAYTIKPVIWGGLAAKLCKGIKFNALITGLGFAFQTGNIKRTLIANIVRTLYKSALSSAKAVIFQNQDNKNRFIKDNIIPEHKAHIINGSGVNLSHFQYSDLPQDSAFTFLTIARLLGEKGLREYALAAKIVNNRYPNIVINILGPEDPSPDGIKKNEITAWKNSGYLNYLGQADDVRPFIKSCHVFVLASYHEGLPRTVLEAMAMGRPILTTNVPGCKDTVAEGINGLLVEKADHEQLAEKMLWFIENQHMLPIMGNNSLKAAQENFDVHKVNKNLLKIIL